MKKSKPLFITTDERTEAPKTAIGYNISSLDANLKYTDERSAFITADDFDNYLLNFFESVFPLYQPQWDNVEAHFNCTTSNLFDPTVCRKIITQLRQCTFSDEKATAFVEKVIAFLEEKTTSCAYIEVYGNI